MTDIRVENHFSICILRPISDEGRDWISDHFAEREDVQWWGQDGLVVEPRYVGDIVAGAQNDGLVVA